MNKLPRNLKGTGSAGTELFQMPPNPNDISDQKLADIRDLPYKEPKATGYDGDSPGSHYGTYG